MNILLDKNNNKYVIGRNEAIRNKITPDCFVPTNAPDTCLKNLVYEVNNRYLCRILSKEKYGKRPSRIILSYFQSI